jgi:hypothetical protein
MLWFQKAEVAELVDALDSGSSGMYVLWGFKSPLRHQRKIGMLEYWNTGMLGKSYFWAFALLIIPSFH